MSDNLRILFLLESLLESSQERTNWQTRVQIRSNGTGAMVNGKIVSAKTAHDID